MQEHQLFLNLGDNNQMVARCSCGEWQEERHLRMCQQVSDVVRELEADFARHVGVEGGPIYVHLPSID
jgi:hypothetical protein